MGVFVRFKRFRRQMLRCGMLNFLGVTQSLSLLSAEGLVRGLRFKTPSICQLGVLKDCSFNFWFQILNKEFFSVF